ncbi:hypothetical protein B0H10DRAFT_1945013 [Mycena sp. CBHHK59/15]|nr:hypothetical protein B0H10DRAFT_1945013 [Mycena sp. CBHHK59/15]
MPAVERGRIEAVLFEIWSGVCSSYHSNGTSRTYASWMNSSGSLSWTSSISFTLDIVMEDDECRPSLRMESSFGLPNGLAPAPTGLFGLLFGLGLGFGCRSKPKPGRSACKPVCRLGKPVCPFSRETGLGIFLVPLTWWVTSLDLANRTMARPKRFNSFIVTSRTSRICSKRWSIVAIIDPLRNPAHSVRIRVWRASEKQQERGKNRGPEDGGVEVPIGTLVAHAHQGICRVFPLGR